MLLLTARLGGFTTQIVHPTLEPPLNSFILQCLVDMNLSSSQQQIIYDLERFVASETGTKKFPVMRRCGSTIALGVFLNRLKNCNWTGTVWMIVSSSRALEALKRMFRQIDLSPSLLPYTLVTEVNRLPEKRDPPPNICIVDRADVVVPETMENCHIIYVRTH